MEKLKFQLGGPYILYFILQGALAPFAVQYPSNIQVKASYTAGDLEENLNGGIVFIWILSFKAVSWLHSGAVGSVAAS